MRSNVTNRGMFANLSRIVNEMDNFYSSRASGKYGCRITNTCMASYSGGSSNAIATNDNVTSTSGNGVVIAASGDDDGDGDGDPDSDRRSLSNLSIPARLAPIQSAVSNRILRMPAVKVRVGLSRSTIYEAISKSEFPASISLGPRAVGWLESDIDAWLERRILASKEAPVAKSAPARITNTCTQPTKHSQE